MANGFFQDGRADQTAYFDMFFRRIPDGGGLAIMAGVAQVIEYLENLSFTEEDIEYLRSKSLFSEEFLDYLRHFRFACDVWAVPEERLFSPHEPIVTVRGPVVQAQFIETMILLAVNHQTLIATKSQPDCPRFSGAGGDGIRLPPAQGYDGAVYGAGHLYRRLRGHRLHHCRPGVRHPALGTMAHSWVGSSTANWTPFASMRGSIP